MALEHLRRLELGGTTPAPVFFQIKSIFHQLESLASARIEGNHTTLADYIETGLESNVNSPSDQLKEMRNIEQAMTYIEEVIDENTPITEFFIRELHQLTVQQLEREGDKTPGAYRLSQVTIAQADHLPPLAFEVPKYMAELVAFINKVDPSKFHLMKVALVHHRFGWIHPFTNGNGRVVRLLTYAMMIKYGFNVGAGGRVLNPTAVFCNDRDLYYQMLSTADIGTDEGLEKWCLYVLEGIAAEIVKVDRLTRLDFLQARILGPALLYARERELITANEEKILMLVASRETTKAKDIEVFQTGLTASQKTYQIRQLVERKMLVPITENSRKYVIGFGNSYLVRGVIRALDNEGYISQALRGTPNE
jgi:Fic family protein